MPRTYDPEFRRRVAELVRSGKSVAVAAAELDLRQRRCIGERPKTSSIERNDPVGPESSVASCLAANRRIRDLQTELELMKNAASRWTATIHAGAASTIDIDVERQAPGKARHLPRRHPLTPDGRLHKFRTGVAGTALRAPADSSVAVIASASLVGSGAPRGAQRARWVGIEAVGGPQWPPAR